MNRNMRKDLQVTRMSAFSIPSLLLTAAWFSVGALVLALSNGLVQHMLDTAAEEGRISEKMDPSARRAQTETLNTLRRSSIAFIFLGPFGLLVYLQQYAFFFGTYGSKRVRITLRFERPHSPILDGPDSSARDPEQDDPP